MAEAQQKPAFIKTTSQILQPSVESVLPVPMALWCTFVKRIEASADSSAFYAAFGWWLFRCRRAVRRRAGPPRRGQPGHGCADGGPGRRPPVARRHRAGELRPALPHLRGLALVRARSERDWLPIAPAAHHLSGGVVTDLEGATALPGLWAVGEMACTGVHGANRLASNSLLEGMVFGARLAEPIEAGGDGPEPSGAMHAVLGVAPIDGIGSQTLDRPTARSRHLHPGGADRGVVGPGMAGPAADEVARLRDVLQHAITKGAGVVRSADSLRRGARRS